MRRAALILALAATLPLGGSEAVSKPARQTWRALFETLAIDPDRDSFRIVIGDSEEARTLGFVPTAQTVRIASIVELRRPELELYWEQPAELPVFVVPAEARIFTRERLTGAPLAAGLREGEQAVLWLATEPGERGWERLSFWLHALTDLGVEPRFRGARTWVFFDPAYRSRVDPAYLARRWREAGIAGVHIAGWPFTDAGPEAAERLNALLAAIRDEGLLAYCWLEPPHISEAFWNDNPACRERTASGQDARLDWRKLVNLHDKECATKARESVGQLLERFPWDGVNLAELYFESLHGPDDPTRFTPMNAAFRESAERKLGFDPLALFDPASDRQWTKDPAAWRAFADYRAESALALQQEWLDFLRAKLPEAHLVVTQIDDRFDPRMRELLGADAAALLALPEDDFTLLVEDPAPLWSEGPERYPRIAAAYEELTDDPGRLAIDINIVERYQQVYPSRKQVGAEFLALIHQASAAFERVTLYFESSIDEADWPLLPHAASTARLIERRPDAGLVVEGSAPFGVRWQGPALVDGELWPVADRRWVWLPAGKHTVAGAPRPPPGRVLWLNAELLGAEVQDRDVVIRYRAPTAAPILLDRHPSETLVDGASASVDWRQTRTHWVARLPAGERTVRIRF